MHGPADQESLRQVALATSQEFQLSQCLDPFRRDFDVEPTRHGDRRAHNALMGGADPALPFLDLRSSHGLDATRFKNVDHLNQAGATSFSIQIAEVLQDLAR